MASGSSGAGRGRGRGAGGGSAGHLGAAIAPRECESCRAAPGIPFCRVEWSFLCTGCAAVVHGQSWIVAVPPSSTPAPNTVAAGAYSVPYACQYPLPANRSPGPNPNPPAAAVPPPPSSQVNPSPSPGANPVHVVQLSSDEDESAGDPGEDDEGSGGRKRRRPSSEGEGAGREASVMRYKEKRKSRNFDKTIRYESRKVHAEMKPRVGGKFAKTADDAADEVEEGAGGQRGDGAGGGDFDSGGHAIRADSSEEMRANTLAQSALPDVQLKPLDPGEMVTTSPSFEVEQFGGVALGQMDGGEEVGLI